MYVAHAYDDAVSQCLSHDDGYQVSKRALTEDDLADERKELHEQELIAKVSNEIEREPEGSLTKMFRSILSLHIVLIANKELVSRKCCKVIVILPSHFDRKIKSERMKRNKPSQTRRRNRATRKTHRANCRQSNSEVCTEHHVLLSVAALEDSITSRRIPNMAWFASYIACVLLTAM